MRKLAIAMHGSERNLVLKEKFMQEVSPRFPGPSGRGSQSRSGEAYPTQMARDPAFKLSDNHDLTKDEIRERTMEKASVAPTARTL